MPRAQTQEFMTAAISWITSSSSIDLNACGARILFIVKKFSGSVCSEMAVVADGIARREQLSMDIRLQLKGQQDSLENLWKNKLQSFARGEGGMTYLGLRSRLLMVKMFGYQGFGGFLARTPAGITSWTSSVLDWWLKQVVMYLWLSVNDLVLQNLLTQICSKCCNGNSIFRRLTRWSPKY